MRRCTKRRVRYSRSTFSTYRAVEQITAGHAQRINHALGDRGWRGRASFSDERDREKREEPGIKYKEITTSGVALLQVSKVLVSKKGRP